MAPAMRYLALLIITATIQCGEDGSRPTPDESPYLDVPAWFEKLAPDARAELAPAVVVATVTPASPASAAGLIVGDRLLAVDGRRLHDRHELRLLRTAMSQGHDQETWTIVRQAQRMSLTISGLASHGPTGATLADADGDPDLATMLARLGAVVPDADAQDLHLLPGRIRHAFSAWLAAHPEVKAPGDAPWIAEWTATYLHVLRGEPVALLTAPMPDEFLERINRFHRAIASAHASGQVANDLQALDCDRWFFALFYPFPTGFAPIFGAPRINAALADMLRRYAEDPIRSRRKCMYFAEQAVQAIKGQQGIERYLGQIAATLVDPFRFGGWVNAGISEWDDKMRDATLAELEARFDAHGEDADLAGVALCAALVTVGRSEQALATAADMFKRSPYLAWRGRMLSGFNARDRQRTADVKLIEAYVDKHPYGFMPPCGEIYNYLMFRNRQLIALCSTYHSDRRRGVPYIARELPDLVASALGRDAWVRDAVRNDIIDSFIPVNNAAWNQATHLPYADREQAAVFAPMIIAIGGEDMDVYLEDTAAACFARAGDYASAQRLEEDALDDVVPSSTKLHDQYAARVELFKSHFPAAEPNEPSQGFVESSDIWPNGGKRAVGLLWKSQRIGTWRFYSDTGSLVGMCGYRGGQPCGACLTYHANGNRAIEGFLGDGGKRIGRWRTWHVNGNLASDGCYAIRDDKPLRTGEWIWYDAAGHRRESGMFLAGQREGNWLAWGDDATLLSRTHFLHDQPEAAWAGTPTPPEPPTPVPVESKPIGNAANEF